ncbi:TonB-dependent receptor [Thalassotalea psychrophila]|uniref:TonB-dependent receptor n=1 Tax=Thalassotalea psychrophila TaxID=3065647 RepID=A0ABY9TQP3_9GAMM|nr:TonB-dependent receptor [Colwelliaceae bacterium SQ149]
MYSNNKLAKAVRLALVFGAASTAGISANAFAAEEATAEEEVERIEVTGSRIKRTDMEGANPVQVITREDLIATGISNMGDILQKIPSVAGAGTNTAINNGGSGAVRVSLRGLGAERTLVLLNGRRMVASGLGANASVDLSTIPTAIVKRVEVLKDGASAIYGSDAIGGVVNIITRNDFEGMEFNASYDVGTEESDGATKTVDLTIGFASEKGSAVVNAYYVQQEAQWSGDRDWSAYEFSKDPDGSFSKGGSSAPPWGRYNGVNSFNPDNFIPELDENGDPVFEDDGSPSMVLPAGTCDSFTHGANSGPGQSDPSDHTSALNDQCWDWGKDTYNYAPANYHLTPQEKYGIYAEAQYEINDSVRVKTELSFNRRTSDTKLAPLPLAPLAFFGYSAPYSADNHYNMTQGPVDMNGDTVEISDWRRRMVETGGRDTRFRVETVRAMFGIEGEIFDDWGYEVSYIFGANDAATAGAGGVNFEKVAEAVGPTHENADGVLSCGANADEAIAGCVPLNVFGVPGTDTAVSQEMMDFILFEAHDLGSNEQQIISASMFGSAFELPAGEVGVAFGVEHREEKGADYPDALIALGITSGSSRTATVGSYEVDEVFVETSIPLLNGVFMAEALDLDLAARYSDYNTFGDTTNYKVGIRWAPTENLIVRGTASTAFRAPSTSDLFAGASDNSPTVIDPCATNPTPTCIADGVPAGGFEPIGDQLSSTRGGSEDVQPEEADIYTVGFVYSPGFVEGLSVTVDYWNIEITDAISTIGEQLILDSCAATGEHCDKIVRYGPDAGGLYGNSSDIDDRTSNVGGVDSSGYDFNARYTTELSFGQLSVNLDTTYYDTYDIIQANGDVLSNGGYYLSDNEGGHGNFAEYKSNLNVSLTQDDWSASYAVRYIGEVDENWYVDDAGDQITRTVDSQVIHDARFTYFMDNVTASIGLNNLTDEEPPFLEQGFNDNTDPRTYSTTGRHAYVSVGVKF